MHLPRLFLEDSITLNVALNISTLDLAMLSVYNTASSG